MSYMDHVIKIRNKLNEVGPGFCAMKWLHETLYLQSGDNHSCYHSKPHNIPLKKLKENPSVLHNTPHKKIQRKTMLSGGRPQECYYCWNIEDLPGDEHYSDRMFHSSSGWIGEDAIDLIKELPWDVDINPRFLELSFGNQCNFKCGYCCPQASNLWVKEIKKYGNYDITYNQYGIEFLNNPTFFENDEDNPYIKAFWEWWPDLKKDLKVLRLTGGDPLVNPNFWKMLDRLDEHPMPDLELNVNSNLGSSNKVVKRMSDKIAKLLKEGKIKTFKAYTSIDSWGKQAEYMCQGLSCDLWEKNIETLINTTGGEITFMITYNVLSVAYFRELLEKILELRKKFNKKNVYKQYIGFDTPYLKEPQHWMMNILPIDEFGSYIDSDLHFIKDNLRTNEGDIFKFSESEFEKFKRVRDYFFEGGPKINESSIKNGRRDFYVFFNEFDKRNDLNMLKIFPRYKKFMKLCKETYNDFE